LRPRLFGGHKSGVMNVQQLASVENDVSSDTRPRLQCIICTTADCQCQRLFSLDIWHVKWCLWPTSLAQCQLLHHSHTLSSQCTHFTTCHWPAFSQCVMFLTADSLQCQVIQLSSFYLKFSYPASTTSFKNVLQKLLKNKSITLIY